MPIVISMSVTPDAIALSDDMLVSHDAVDLAEATPLETAAVRFRLAAKVSVQPLDVEIAVATVALAASARRKPFATAILVEATRPQDVVIRFVIRLIMVRKADNPTDIEYVLFLLLAIASAAVSPEATTLPIAKALEIVVATVKDGDIL